jgi:hypothetical protein
VAGHIFQARPVWIYTQSNITSIRTLYVYAHAYLAQKYSVGLQEIFVSRLCSQEENSLYQVYAHL